MSVEQQFFDLVESGTSRAAPEITHTLSTMGDGHMIQGIKKVWKAGIDVGMNRGFTIGFEAGEKAGVCKGLAIGIGSAAAIYIVCIGVKRWREHQVTREERTVTSITSNEALSIETDIPETDDSQNPFSIEDVGEQQHVDESTHIFQSAEKLPSTIS